MSAPAIQAKWEGLEGIGAGRDALNTQISWEACILELCLTSLKAPEDALKERA